MSQVLYILLSKILPISESYYRLILSLISQMKILKNQKTEIFTAKISRATRCFPKRYKDVKQYCAYES